MVRMRHPSLALCSITSLHLRRALAIAAALIISRSQPRGTPAPQRMLHDGNARAVGAAHLADHAGTHRRAGAVGARSRLQHAAGAGARARRRVLSTAASNRAPRTCCGSRRPSIRSHRPRAGARGGAARARVGQRQPGLERRRSAGCARARRLSPSRVADGAARYRAGAGDGTEPDSPAYVGKLARWTRAQPSERRRSLCVADHARRRPITRRPSCAISPAATRSTASTSTTRATRAIASTTAARDPRSSATRCPP